MAMYCTCSVSLVFLHPDDACNHDGMLFFVDSELSSLNSFSIDVSERKSCRGFVFSTSFIIGYKFWFFLILFLLSILVSPSGVIIVLRLSGIG